MNLELQAQRVEVGVLCDLDVFLVSMAGGGKPPCWSLIFSLGSHPTEQDAQLGQDTYDITTHEQVSCYGGLKNWSNAGREFTLKFESAAALLGIEETVLILVDESQVERLSDGFRHITQAEADRRRDFWWWQPTVISKALTSACPDANDGEEDGSMPSASSRKYPPELRE